MGLEPTQKSPVVHLDDELTDAMGTTDDADFLSSLGTATCTDVGTACQEEAGMNAWQPPSTPERPEFVDEVAKLVNHALPVDLRLQQTRFKPINKLGTLAKNIAKRTVKGKASFKRVKKRVKGTRLKRRCSRPKPTSPSGAAAPEAVAKESPATKKWLLRQKLPDENLQHQNLLQLKPHPRCGQKNTTTLRVWACLAMHCRQRLGVANIPTRWTKKA